MENQYINTLIVSLVDSDTNRIMANDGDDSGKGSQYIWLSVDCMDFFPPLDKSNEREKVAEYTLINLHYIDLRQVCEERVTYEKENNGDVRLGTGRYRYTKIARPGDLACITRTGPRDFEIRIIGQSYASHAKLLQYATNPIGHKGKRFGLINTNTFFELV